MLFYIIEMINVKLAQKKMGNSVCHLKQTLQFI